MKRRDSEHFRRMMERNPSATVGLRLAASAVYAAATGECEAEHHDSEQWRVIYLDLQSRHGESMSSADVLAEMKAVAP